MAKRTASQELRVTSVELNVVKDAERHLTQLLKKAEQRRMQNIALEIIDVVNLERRVEELLKEQMRLEEQQYRWEDFNPNSPNITKIVNKLKVIANEIERTDAEIIRREGILVNQLGKTQYDMFKGMLKNIKITRQQIMRMAGMLA